MDRGERAFPADPARPLEEPTPPEPGAHPAPAGAQRQGWLVFCPHRTVDAVTHVLPADLLARGIAGVILDLDNTLVRWQKEEMTEEVLAWLNALKAAGIRLCILSNSFLSRRSARIGERLNCPVIRMAQKPRRSGFQRALAAMGTTPATTAIVGDQIFTDIWGGNRVGIYTILVKPLHTQEFVYTRFVSRPPERLLLRMFKKRGHI